MLSVQQLLDLVNERLVADRGHEAALHTLEQVQQQINEVAGVEGVARQAADGSWAHIRRLLIAARKEGVLDQVTETVINDFAVVYSLNAKQHLALKEVLLAHNEDRG